MYITWLQLTLTSLFWAGTFIAGKMLGDYLPAASGAFLRFVMASVCMVPLLGSIPAAKRMPAGRNWIWIILAGVASTFLYNLFFLKGLQLIEASRASLIVATCPVFITLSSWLILREKLHRVQIPGILLAVLGAIIVISRGQLSQVFSGALGMGEFYIFGCVGCWVTYTLISRKIASDLPPATVVTWCCIIGAVCLAPGAWQEGFFLKIARLPQAAWWLAAYLAVFGNAVGFVWYNRGLEKIGPSRTGLFINLIPPFTVVLSYFILHEPITWPMLLGMLMVIAGLVITNSRRVVANS